MLHVRLHSSGPDAADGERVTMWEHAGPSALSEKPCGGVSHRVAGNRGGPGKNGGKRRRVFGRFPAGRPENMPV